MKIYGVLKTLFLGILLTKKEALSLAQDNSSVNQDAIAKNQNLLNNYPLEQVQNNEFGQRNILTKSDAPSLNVADWKKSEDPSHVKIIYDGRYTANSTENGKSVYEDRFSDGREVAEGEEYFLSNSFREAIDNFKKSEKESELNSKNSVFTVFSFGCGAGRDLEFFGNLAKELQNIGSKLVVKAYDISPNGLELYKTKLLNHKFREGGEIEEKNLLKNHGVLSKDNFEVQLYSPHNPEIDPQALAQNIGNVDVTCSLFGPTSHIFPSRLRDNFLAEFVKMTREKIILTLPGHAFALDYQKIWGGEHIRETFHLERGEIFYRAKDLEAVLDANKNKNPKDKDWERVNLPYKLYDMGLIGEWLDNANIKKENAVIAVSNYKTNPGLASKNPNSGWFDSYLAYAASIATSYAPEIVKALDQSYFQPISRVEYYGLNIRGGAEKTPSTSPKVTKESVNKMDEKRDAEIITP